jgi:cellulose synthase/poly-beta-1,6-N-acetylglucosamine synthase-like glycosyltransferase
METLDLKVEKKTLFNSGNPVKTKVRKLTIILPVYNPHEGWEKRLVSVLNKLEVAFRDVEYYVTVVNDGSTNDISFFIENELIPAFPNLRYFSYQKNRGKGYAIRYGLKHSSSDYYIYTDFDIPFGIISVRETYDALIKGKNNLVLGKRGFSYLKALPPKRLALSLGFMFLNVIHTGFRVSDTQAGLKGLDNKTRLLFLSTTTNGFVFELEFIMKCLKAKTKYSKIKVNPEKGIKLSNFGSHTIRQEFENYIKIIFESRKTPTNFF